MWVSFTTMAPECHIMVKNKWSLASSNFIKGHPHPRWNGFSIYHNDCLFLLFLSEKLFGAIFSELTQMALLVVLSYAIHI